MKARPGAFITCILLAWACGAEADTHYVSETSPSPGWPYTTPDTAAGSIASAMDAASCGDTVLVLPGYYQDIWHPEGTLLKPGVNLIGSGPARTVIFGSPLLLGEQFPDPDLPACPGPMVISGLRLVDSPLGLWQGVPAATATVSECYFDGSTVSVNGVARWDVTFRRCLFRNIREVSCKYALHAFHTGALKVLDCWFDLSNSLGRTGGVALFGTYPAVISGCTFTACASAIHCFEGTIRITNCLFLRNDRAVEVVVAETSIEASTFVGNRHAIWTTDQCDWGPKVRNCIFWASAEANVFVERSDGFGLPEISFSDVEGGYPGQGIIDADPMFFLPSGDEPDLHLCAFSPCIDAGDPFSDYSNEPEPNGGRVNMGAYGNTWEATTSELVDTDGDNLRDDWEIENFGDLTRDGSSDADRDGLSDREEYRHLSDPNNRDSDGDGLLDGQEVSLGTDPLVPDTDNDGTPDAEEVAQGTNPLDWKDGFTVLDFSIKEGHLHITYPTLPGYEYSLESSNWPNGPFGFTVEPYRGRYGVLSHTDVLFLGPYNRFFRIRAREYPGGEGSR